MKSEGVFYLGQNAVIKDGVILGDCVSIGSNTLIESYTIIRNNVFIGEHSEIRQYCFLAGDILIGDNVKIFQYSNISKGSIIQDCVYIGPRVLFLNTRKISHGRKYTPELKSPVIERGARIGGGTILTPGITIGQECMIGAGSVVTKDTEPFWVYVGTPAQKLKPVPEDEWLLWG